LAISTAMMFRAIFTLILQTFIDSSPQFGRKSIKIIEKS
jgi:hypothetical protein